MNRLLTLSGALLLSIASAFADGLPSLSEPARCGYTADSVVSRLRNAPLAAIEGLWRLTPDGATIAIERQRTVNPEAAADHFDITVVSSPDRSVRPGTVIGLISAGGDADVFEASIYTRRRDGRFYLPHKFTLTLNDAQGRLEFRKHRSRVSINLWHFVPFLWRYSVRMRPSEGRAYLPGAVRLYPSPAKPLEPVYL